jgi:cytochrome c peroxidase
MSLRLMAFARTCAGLACVCGAALSCAPKPAPVDAAFAVYAAGLSHLDSALIDLDAAISARRGPDAQRAFRAARTAYKRIELFVEYHGAFTSREVNSPPIPRAESEDPETPLAPAGLQVIEAELFPEPALGDDARLRHEIGVIRTAVTRLRDAGADSMPGDAFLFDAMRHEIARVGTLGIAGFDATVSGDAIRESADALDGLGAALAPYRSDIAHRDAGALRALDERLAAAAEYLRQNPDFERFDRLTFLATRLQPLAHAFAGVQAALGIGAPPRPRAWSAHAASIYDRDAFDPMFFAATDATPVTPLLAALGRDLFFDNRLSPDGTRSCATCHVPERAFTDGQPRAQLLPGHSARDGGRNTPTLINAALEPSLFADARVRTLEDQATDVLGSPSEMGGSLQRAADAFRADRSYVSRFAVAFKVARDTALTPRSLRLALAAYVRSLVALDSRFDRAIRGDTAALDARERLGFNVFMGKAACGTCHFAPLFTGAMPPMMLENEPEVIGVPSRATSPKATIDPDSGRFNVRRIDQHLHAFKTPTLRNVELTAPYMHNGVFETLEQVVDFYDGGGGHGLGIDLPHQTLPTDSLHLSNEEKRALVAFMKALTDTAGMTARPSHGGPSRR